MCLYNLLNIINISQSLPMHINQYFCAVNQCFYFLNEGAQIEARHAVYVHVVQ